MRSEVQADKYNPYQLSFLDMSAFVARKNASDIHIEPKEAGILIRVRNQGVMTSFQIFENDAGKLYFESVKALLGFDMSKIGVPQDTRFRHPHAAINCRGSLLPTIWGEKICLRILQRNVSFSLDTYSLEPEVKDRLKSLIDKKEGLILISGPTGSGKSTLMYSALGSIDANTKCVYTVEDPVEYELAELIQVPINHRKVSFASALRTLMRQDPDVIMIGEIRDEETAKIAVNAAGTGHLVIATVHANSAEQVLGRMKNLGIPEYDLKSVLLMSSAQRLVRLNCVHCLESDSEPTANEKLRPARYSKRSKGCNECGMTGFGSRTLVFEGLFKKDGRLEQVGSITGSLLSLYDQGLISNLEYTSNNAI